MASPKRNLALSLIDLLYPWRSFPTICPCSSAVPGDVANLFDIACGEHSPEHMPFKASFFIKKEGLCWVAVGQIAGWKNECFFAFWEVASEDSEERPKEPYRQWVMAELRLKETWGLGKLYPGLTLPTRALTHTVYRGHRKSLYSTQVLSPGCTLESPGKPQNV